MNFKKSILNFFGKETSKTKGLILFGLPGAGKGTYGSSIAKDFKLLKISPGDLIRKMLKDEKLKDDPLIKTMKLEVNKGNLISDEMAFNLVNHEFKNEGKKFKGVIFDGIPRTLKQVTLLKNDFDLSNFLLVNVILREDILIEKLMGRRVCNKCGRNYNICKIDKDGYLMDPLMPAKENKCDDCQGNLVLREDDKEDIIKDRINVYKQETLPVMGELQKLTQKTIDFEPKRGINDYPILRKMIMDIWKE